MSDQNDYSARTPRMPQDASEPPDDPNPTGEAPDASSEAVAIERRCLGTNAEGERCKSWAKKGTKWCKFHGGSNCKGIASPKFVDGSYSKYLPTGLMNDYERAIHDPDLLSLRHDIALLHARVTQLIGRLHTGESGGLWGRLKEVFMVLRQANLRQNQNLVDQCILEMFQLISDGSRDEEAWMAIQDTIEKKSQLTSKEWRRMIDMHQIMTVEEAMHMVTQIVLAVRENVRDPDALHRISEKVSMVLVHKNANFVSAAPAMAEELEKKHNK